MYWCSLPKSDYIRLNLASIHDLPEMFVEKSMELYGIEITDLAIKLEFNDHMSNYHVCPINGHTNWGGRNTNLPTGYPGWQGNIEFESKYKENIFNLEKIKLEAFLENTIKFKGLNTCGGMPGRINQHKTSLCFYVFLEDFPLLVKNKEKHKLMASFQENKSWSEKTLKVGEFSYYSYYK